MPDANPGTLRQILSIGFDLLVAWYIFFVAGTIQYRILKRKTIELVLKYAGQPGGIEPATLPERIYEKLYPEWAEMVRKTAWFIPSKNELWPIPASVENVKKRFGFSPKWVQECLKDKRPDLMAGKPAQ